ncbi:MAG: phenylacetate--CoA ligase [Eubacteriales bacterium]|nr:phenylacetate--CoA ligase [Eubacteriales bacterium]
MLYYNKSIETATYDEMFHLQSYRLSKTVRRAYDNVPLYKQRIDAAGIFPEDIKSVDDLRKLPYTQKKDLRDTYPYGMFAVPRNKLVRVHASSGTTGKQTVVGYTQNDIDLWSECVARALVAAGTTEDDFVHVSYGYGLFTGGLGLHYGVEKLGATAIPASSGNTARQITMLQDFGSSVLCCTPSYALYISDVLRQQNIDPKTINLKSGIFGAEPWSENMRHEIEARLNVKAFDIYGLSEICGPGVSFDCEYQNGLHVNEDHFLIEIVDPESGMPLPDGEPGEVVFTCISKEALPLLRYNTHDISSITHERCECGRTLVRMDRITGRSDDMLIIRGVNVFPSQIESVLLSVGQIEPHYLIVVDRQNNLDTLEIKVEMSLAAFSDKIRGLEELERRIRGSLESVLGISAKITFVEANTIQRSEGKAKRVIDNRKL